MKKLMVFGISFLFLILSISSSAADINKNIKIRTIEKSEIKPLDNNMEIITYITGWGDPSNVTFKGFGQLYFEMWEEKGISIEGLKYPLFPLKESKFSETCKHVIAPCFILLYYVDYYGACFVIGIALGNIEWD
jgi:hypothetical protein